MSTNPGLTKIEHTECLICNKPLGAESRDEGFMLCHEHRICNYCKEPEPISISDARWCLNKFLKESEQEQKPFPDYMGFESEIFHIECYDKSKSNLSKDPTRTITQSEIDYLNLIRLSIIPDTNLSYTTNEENAKIYSMRLIAGMDYEQKWLHLKMLESCTERVQTAILQDPKHNKGYLAEREQKRFNDARNEAIENNRPHIKIVKSSKESLLNAMVKEHELNPLDRAANLKLLSDRDKSIKGLIRSGFTEEHAIEATDKSLLKQGRFKK